MAAAAAGAERILVYPGCGTDVGPLMLLTSKGTLVETSDALADLVACAELEKSDSADRIVDIFDSVDRFVMFDMSPYIYHPKTRERRLSVVYTTFDHYVKFVETYLKMLVTDGVVLHNEEEHFFACTVRRTGGKKHLEWHYDTDFFNIKPGSRIHRLMQEASVVYQQGYVFEDPSHPDTASLYTSFPNADTVLMQAMGLDKTREEHQQKFEKHITHDRGVRVVLHPSLTRGIFDLAH